MSRIAKLATASMIALCLCGSSAVRADANIHPIRVVCDDARLAVLCHELARMLADGQTAYPVEVSRGDGPAQAAHLTLRFVTESFSDSVLAGHLNWSDGAGRTGAGARIDLTVMDARIDDGMMHDYARQLLNFTDLPL